MDIVANQTLPAIIQPFDAVAREYDAQFTDTSIGKAQRESVWRETDRWFQPGQRVLDINCGTGVDALHLAARGIRVVACDSSPEMVAVARRRLEVSPHRVHINLRALAIEQLRHLDIAELHDGVLSNFSGLNCVANVQAVAGDLARLVKPGGIAILCVFGRFCVWEMAWYLLHGKFRKAFRRFNRCGSIANLAPGHSVLVRYPSVRSIQQDFSPQFRLLTWKGVGVAVPPSYMERCVRWIPRLFRMAVEVDPLLGACPGFRAFADHVLLVFKRVEA